MGHWYRGRNLHQNKVSYEINRLTRYINPILTSDKVYTLSLHTSTFDTHPTYLHSYIAPSGVQKERIKPTDIFVLPYPSPSPHTDRTLTFLRRPSNNLKESACTPLFWNTFDLRDAGSCVHTHSQHAVMATLLWPGDVFEISHLEAGSSGFVMRRHR